MNSRSSLENAAMIAFAVSGAASVAFGMFSVLGTLMGLVMSGVFLFTFDEEALIGLPILLFYGLWMVICLVAGGLHLRAAMLLKRNEPPGRWLLAAIVAGLTLAITVYCAAFGLVSAALGGAVYLQDDRA